MRKFFVLATLVACSAFANEFIASDGATLHYTIVGSGDPVIVLAGGPGFSTGYVQGLTDHIAKSHAAVVLDQRGTGASALTSYDAKTLTLALVVDDLERLRTALKVDKLTLVGHSWGGMLAMLYAAAHPEHVGKIVLVDSGGPNTDFIEPFGKALDARITAADEKQLAYWRDPERKKANPRHAVVEAMKVKTYAYFHDRANGKALVEAMNDDSYDVRVNKFVMMDMAARGYDVRAAMQKLTIPVLIVQGDDDPIGAYDGLRAAFPRATAVLVKDSGHFPWIEQPAAFWRVVDDFLKP